METGIQSSFIPQDAAKQTVVPVRREGGGLADLFFLLSIVALVASLALAGAVFLYDQYLASNAASKVEQLKRARDAFEPSLVQQLTRLDDRMHAADSILIAHIAPTAFFRALEQTTLSTVAFTSLILNAPDPQHITLKMTGVARSVNSIALQADLFSKNGTITNPIFSDIGRQSDGVHFTLNGQVNPSSVGYVQMVSGSQLPQSAQAPAVGASESLFGGGEAAAPPAQGAPPAPAGGPQPSQAVEGEERFEGSGAFGE